MIAIRNNQQKWKFKFFENGLPPELQMKARELLDGNSRQELTIEQLIAEREKFCSNPFGCLLAIEVEEVIGVLILFKRQIYHSEPIILGGLGRLCVVQEKRKKEAGYILLKKGMQELKEYDCDVAYLRTNFSDSALVKLHKRLGFVQKPYTFLGQSEKKYEEGDGMIAPLRSKKKFLLILKNPEPLHIGVGNC